jgi:hypothetical protein
MTFPRITKITPQTWMEEVPVMEPDWEVQTTMLFRAVIWIEVKGGVYARDLTEGETVNGVVEAYRKSGRIDDECCFVTEI